MIFWIKFDYLKTFGPMNIIVNIHINKEQKISIVVIAIQKNIYIMEWFFRQMILYIFL